jgi:hypothetical protein
MKIVTATYKYLVLFVFLMGLCLVSCTSGRDRIDRLVETLPVPPNVDLLYEQEGVNQGSEDACFFPYEKRLYGTNQDFKQIVKFYEDVLDPTIWRKWRDNYTPPGSPSWRKDKDFWLDLRSDPRLDFPEKTVNDAQSNYESIYFLTVTYSDRIAREKCLGERD